MEPENSGNAKGKLAKSVIFIVSVASLTIGDGSPIPIALNHDQNRLPVASSGVNRAIEVESVNMKAPVAATLQAVETMYVVRDAPSVRRYLKAHADLLKQLVDAHSVLSQVFPDAEFSIEVSHDAKPKMLLIQPQFAGSAEDAMNRMLKLHVYRAGWPSANVKRMYFALEFI